MLLPRLLSLAAFLVACRSATAPAVRDVSQAAGVVVFDGNSLTSPLHGHTPYPVFVIDELGTPARLQSLNVAVPGQTTVDMIARAAANVDAQHTSEPVNVVVLWEGTNDLYFGATPEAAYQHLLEYSIARRRAGWRVVVLTVMPRSGVNTRADFEIVRQALNAALRANWRSFADELDDVAADPRFGAAGAELDLTYFEDGTHLTQYGIEQMAIVATPAIKRAILAQLSR